MFWIVSSCHQFDLKALSQLKAYFQTVSHHPVNLLCFHFKSLSASSGLQSSNSVCDQQVLSSSTSLCLPSICPASNNWSSGQLFVQSYNHSPCQDFRTFIANCDNKPLNMHMGLLNPEFWVVGIGQYSQHKSYRERKNGTGTGINLTLVFEGFPVHDKFELVILRLLLYALKIVLSNWCLQLGWVWDLGDNQVFHQEHVSE